MSRHLMTPEHFAQITAAKNHYELFCVARDILELMNAPIGMVCGPISTGGLGSVAANIQRFNEAIDYLLLQKISIFNQMPFEPKLAELLNPDHTGYDWRILNDFYEPIFQTGMIKTKFFIPGWQSSTGARRERELATVSGIKVIDLDQDLKPIW